MTIIEPGAMARTTAANLENNYAYRQGMEFVVEEYATAEEAESDDGKGYYIGSSNGGSYNVEVREDHAELVRSAKDMNARTIPTPADLAEYIASESFGGFWGDLEIDEADYSAKDGTFEVYGKTREGLRFAAVVRVLTVEGADF